MRYLLISSVSLVFVFLTIGCTVTAKQPTLHDFGVPGSATTHESKPVMKQVDGVYAPSQKGTGAVTVNAPTWLWDNRIRYRLLYVAPTNVSFYGLDMWIAPPPELFGQMLISNMKTLNCSLNIQLLEFEQQFDASDRAREVLRFSVDAYSGDNKQKIGTQEFHLEQSAKTPDAAGAVSGFTDLTRQAIGRVQTWLAGLPPSPKSSAPLLQGKAKAPAQAPCLL
jgi:cholesterol transport system auxiliary component